MATKNLYKMFNETTRKYETIDLDEAELIPGQTVVKMFYIPSDDKFVTVPGASLFRVTQSLDLELIND